MQLSESWIFRKTAVEKTSNTRKSVGPTSIPWTLVPWTLVQGTTHTRTLKNKLPFSLAFRSRVLNIHTRNTTGDHLFNFFLLVHVAGVVLNPPWDTLLASCGRRSPLRSVSSRREVSVHVRRVVCQVAEAVLIFIDGTERGRGCRFSFRLETPLRGGGAFTPSWSRYGVVSFVYLVHGQGGSAGEGVVRGRSFEFGWCGPSGRGKRESDSDAEPPSFVSRSSGHLSGLSDWVSRSQTWGAEARSRTQEQVCDGRLLRRYHALHCWGHSGTPDGRWVCDD